MYDGRHGAGRDLLRASADEAKIVLDTALIAERSSIDDERALERAALATVELYRENGKVVSLPTPSVEQLRRHRDKFMPSITHPRAAHRQSVQDVADVYGIDLAETRSKDAITRLVGRKKVMPHV